MEPETKEAAGAKPAENTAEPPPDRDIAADRAAYGEAPATERHRDAEPRKGRSSPRQRPMALPLERRQAPAPGSGPPLTLSGTRAFGVSSLVALSLCAIIVHSRMYYSLQQAWPQPSGRPTHFDPAAHQGDPQQSHAVSPAQEERVQMRRVDLTLQQAVENVAGPNRSIIFVSTSRHYLPFLENWYVSVSRFGYGGRVLFIAEDEASYEYLRERWPAQTVLVQLSDLGLHEYREDAGATPGAGNSTYGSKHYNLVVDRRPEYFKALIDLNVSFLYNDVDIVWLKDPYAFFTGEFDMWVQEDAIVFSGALARFEGDRPALPMRHKHYALCTCFMMVHPTRASRRLIHRWSRHVRAQVEKGGQAVLNQPAFNKALSLTPDRDIKVGVLPVLQFPSGYLFFRCRGQPYCRRNWKERNIFLAALKKRKTWPAVVHNNWLEGYQLKLNRFKEYKLWFLNDTR